MFWIPTTRPTLMTRSFLKISQVMSWLTGSLILTLGTKEIFTWLLKKEWVSKKEKLERRNWRASMVGKAPRQRK
jgi:putative Mn2+ efflux pump MntP